MPILTQGVPTYDYNPLAPVSLIGAMETGASGFIEIWEDGNPVSISSSGLTEIGDTGNFCWSLGNMPPLTKARQQFHWRMTGGAFSDEGDFILQATPPVQNPALRTDFVIDPRP